MTAASPSPLVGRDREFTTLRARLTAAAVGQGSVVLIGGEAGIGKTALADALLREAEKQGALILIGRCYDLSETPPYGPWLELFARYDPADDFPAPPSAFARRGGVGAVAGQATLFEEVRDFFTALTAPRRDGAHAVVLLLDDLHWADPASLELLRFIARSVTTLPILILVIYRDDELTSRHPLYLLLPLLEREARAARLMLRPLPHDAIRDLVATRYPLSETDAAALVAYLVARGGERLFHSAGIDGAGGGRGAPAG